MAKVTEQDVITFLKEKISTLSAELKRTQAALDAFSANSSPVAQAALTEEEAPVKGRRGRKPGQTKSAQEKQDTVKSLDVPSEFNPGGKLDSKVAYVLANNGPLFNTEIIEKLKELEPEKDGVKLEKAVMVKLSALHKAGRIKGAKVGRKFKYEL